MKHSKKILILIILVVAWVLLFFAQETKAEAPAPTYEDKINLWIEAVRWEESRGHDMIVVLDTNKKYSYGCLQYQMGTWNHFAKKYGITAEIMDCNAQKQLTRFIVEREKDGWRNWYTTVIKKGVGLPPLP